MKHITPYNDITRTTLSVLSIGMLIIAAFWIVRPFLLPLLWASMIVSATWPILLRLEKMLRGKRSLAVVAMTVLLTLLVLAPLVTAVGIILANTDRIMQWIEALSRLAVLPPPEWLESIPLIGPQVTEFWQEINLAGTLGLAGKVTPYIKEILLWLFNQAGNPGKLLLDFLLTVIIAGVLYSIGELAAQGVLRFAHRLAGERGETVEIGRAHV